jgi:phosphate transport system substrate-binding protein
MRCLKQLLVIATLFTAGCSSVPLRIAYIRIKGSDTMLSMMHELAVEFSRNNPGITISVEGGGTSLGVKSLCDGTIDICTASRVLLPEETKLLAEKHGSIGISTYVARDALCILVNKKNTISNLTLDQVTKIFTGKIITWKDVGGKDKLIQPVRRNDYSGTAGHFKTRVLEDEEFGQSVQIKSSLENLLNELEENPNAIGFSGLVRTASSKVISIDGIHPTKETIKSGAYPLGRYLYLYSISTPSGVTKDFIDWILSPPGQLIIDRSGFIPLFENTY